MAWLQTRRWPEPCACHHCDNRACCNERHLFEGTQTENIADMDRKGRRVTNSAPPGQRHHGAKLTDQDVRDIRANYALCRMTQKELAARFGIAQSTVSGIVSGKEWAHVRP